MTDRDERGQRIVTDQQKLRVMSLPATIYEVEKYEVVKKMKEAMKYAWHTGAGLAAVQIGIPIRYAWYKFGNTEGVLLNPIIVERWGEDVQNEGCLSIPDFNKEVERAWTIEYTSNGKRKRANGFLARLIQHEIDHMDGILIIDK